MLGTVILMPFCTTSLKPVLSDTLHVLLPHTAGTPQSTGREEEPCTTAVTGMLYVNRHAHLFVCYEANCNSRTRDEQVKACSLYNEHASTHAQLTC